MFEKLVTTSCNTAGTMQCIGILLALICFVFQVKAQSDVVHTKYAVCLLHEIGTTECMGHNNDYVHMSSSTDLYYSYFMITNGVEDGKKIIAGDTFVCILDTHSDLVCWGRDVPISGVSGRLTPTRLDIPGAVKDAWAFGNALCFTFQNSGNTYCERSDGSGMDLISTSPIDTVTGENGYLCILYVSGEVWCEGESNDYGRLGRGTSSVSSTTAVKVISNAKFLTCKDNVCAVLASSDDHLYMWGRMDQYGRSSTERSPVIANSWNGQSVAVNRYVTCVTIQFGAIECLGNGAARGGMAGDPGLGSLSATAISQPYNVIRVTQTKNDGFCVVMERRIPNESIYCWGHVTDSIEYTTPVFIVSVNLVLFNHKHTIDFEQKQKAQIAMGYSHTCYIANGGEVYCWGENTYKQCGQASGDVFSTPVKVPFISSAVRIYANMFMTCVITYYHEGYCWGMPGNTDGDYVNMGGPNRPDDLSTYKWTLHDTMLFSELSIGNRGMCGIRRNSGRDIWCWGYRDTVNGYINSRIPSYMGLSGGSRGGVVSIGILETGGCAVTQYEQIYCWGTNWWHQFGQDSTDLRHTEPRYKSSISANHISCGDKHCCSGKLSHNKITFNCFDKLTDTTISNLYSTLFERQGYMLG